MEGKSGAPAKTPALPNETHVPRYQAHRNVRSVSSSKCGTVLNVLNANLSPPYTNSLYEQFLTIHESCTVLIAPSSSALSTATAVGPADAKIATCSDVEVVPAARKLVSPC